MSTREPPEKGKWYLIGTRQDDVSIVMKGEAADEICVQCLDLGSGEYYSFGRLHCVVLVDAARWRGLESVREVQPTPTEQALSDLIDAMHAVDAAPDVEPDHDGPELEQLQNAYQKFEKAMEAAIRANGDTWQPVDPPMMGAAIRALATLDPIPSWISFMGIFRLIPDIQGLCKEGFFTKSEEHGPITPTDLFFERVARWVTRRGEVL